MQYRRYVFWAVLAFAAIVRIKGLATGLPLHTLYGENDTFQTLLQMLRTGDWNPNQFLYPGLAYYIYLPFLYLFYWIGHITGYFSDIQSVPEASLIFIGRFISALLGTFSVYLVYRISKYFSEAIALLAMAIFATIPQHIEFSHMLRPEIPAVFFLLIAQYFAIQMFLQPERKAFWFFGLSAGACFATKYNIGLPLLLVLPAAWLLNRREIRWPWILQSFLLFFAVFAAADPYLVADPTSIPLWMRRLDSFYVPSEDYYSKRVVFYYLEFLTRYNYNLPLILASLLGMIVTLFRDWKKGLLLAVYPLCLFLWLCTFESRRIHGLLPLHPYLAIWAASTLNALWYGTKRVSDAPLFRIAYGLLLSVILFFPFYRSCVQTYLLSRVDNRSKAELWMTNRLARGSRIALLQYHQIELDGDYFKVVSFSPRDYVGNRNFDWFAKQGFDYVVLSSGQYMRYFVEGPKAAKYKDYFLNFFRDASQQGTLVLDLMTHPTLIPDYRIKVYSTRKLPVPPEFYPAVEAMDKSASYHLSASGVMLNLTPGYYKLQIPHSEAFRIRIKNLKLNEMILQTNTPLLSAAESVPDNGFPFALFPARMNSRISLFSGSHPEMTPNQLLQFQWSGLPDGLEIKQIQPEIWIHQVDFPEKKDIQNDLPYVLMEKNEESSLHCSLQNITKTSISGYVEAFLSQIGEPQPWKNFEVASSTQEFFLEGGQEIKIDVPFSTKDLTGDHQLSYWIFTRHDLPFSPQNGGWFSRQIRVDDPRLGIHPIYGVPIP